MQERSGATCHMALPQCCYSAKGAKRPSHTTNTSKFDRIQFDPCNSIKRFDLCPFDQKSSTYLQPPTKSDHKFFQRTMIIYNYVLRALKGARPAKTTLTQIHRNFFNKRYSQIDKCTWKILCRCGNCNTMTRLTIWDWTDNWEETLDLLL